mgnify:CR=1 FL=1
MISDTILILLLPGGGVPIGGGGEVVGKTIKYLLIRTLRTSFLTYHPTLRAPLLQLEKGN